MRDSYARNFVLPNYTPVTWFECDVFEVTQAGYFVEYEIKLSRSDFKADAAKKKHVSPYLDPKFITFNGTKHELLGRGDSRGPNRFYFVTPRGMLLDSDIPKWAGLIEVWLEPGCRHVSKLEKKPAPKLHGEKIGDGIMTHARSTCYWRMHRMMASQSLNGSSRQENPQLPECPPPLSRDAITDRS